MKCGHSQNRTYAWTDDSFGHPIICGACLDCGAVFNREHLSAEQISAEREFQKRGGRWTEQQWRKSIDMKTMEPMS